jgi:HK97 gp10 family phage protein
MAVEVKGVDAVLQNIDESIGIEKIEKNIQKACAIVERAAKQNAPKGTGELRRSIASRVEADTEGNVVGLVFSPLEYAPYVEYGTGLFAEAGNGRKDVPWNYQDDKGEWHSTSGMKPRPFLRPALEDNRLEVISAIKEGMKND